MARARPAASDLDPASAFTIVVLSGTNVWGRGWDPSDPTQGPTGGDHGPYELLPGNKLKITCDVCDIQTKYRLFSYDLEGATLTLRWIRDVDPDYSAHDRRMSLAYAIANTSMPFHKIG